MARRPRRTHSPKLKAKVALAAIVGDKTIAELAVLHDVHPNQITEWKRQLVDRAADVFGGEPNTPPQAKTWQSCANLMRCIYNTPPWEQGCYATS